MQALVGRFEKTAAGRSEIATRGGTLCRSSRALLIMVDGQTDAQALAARAGQLGLEAGAVIALLEAGFIQRADAAQSAPVGGPTTPVQTAITPHRKRSVAAARMYLMDIAARTFSSVEHPIRRRLVEATDRDAVEGAFDALLAALREATSASMVEQVESAFRGFLPAEAGSAG